MFTVCYFTGHASESADFPMLGAAEWQGSMKDYFQSGRWPCMSLNFQYILEPISGREPGSCQVATVVHTYFSSRFFAMELPSTPAWLPLQHLQLSHALVVPMLLLAAAHLCLTKTDLQRGLARLREKIQQCTQLPSQRELDQARRFEAELLRVRLEIFQSVPSEGKVFFSFSFCQRIACSCLRFPSFKTGWWWRQ